jgi:hypothetical protein
MILFATLWAAAGLSAIRRSRNLPAGALDPVPILLYAFLFMMLFNFHFLAPWAIAAVCYSFAGHAEPGGAHA